MTAKQAYETPRTRFFVLQTENFMTFNSDGNETTTPGGEEDLP